MHLSVRASDCHTSVSISFPDDHLSKYQWIFAKFGICIDIMKVWFGISNGHFDIFDRIICLQHKSGRE